MHQITTVMGNVPMVLLPLKAVEIHFPGTSGRESHKIVYGNDEDFPERHLLQNRKEAKFQNTV